MKILYIDPIFGISGDMMISAFIDAGLPFERLQEVLNSIPIPLPAMAPEKKSSGVIEGIHLKIDHSHTHLSIRQMEELIGGLKADGRIIEDARAMLDIILEAESKVHGTSKNEVHLHELAHVDTLIDLVSVATAMRYFEVDKVYCGPVPHGRGTIKISHGIMPNPPPVTLEILSGFKTVFLEEPLELTTPTGATIVRHYVKDPGPPPSMNVERTGYGVGTYKTDKPDILRIFIGEAGGPHYEEEVWLIECDMDDMDIEYLGAVAERMRSAGALDVLYFPVYMKKGRLGVRLSVTVKEETLSNLLVILFKETTTFGVRMRKEQRRTLKRENKVLQTSYGPLSVKYGYDEKGTLVKTHIEFEDVKRIADERDLPYRVLLEALKKEAGSGE
jgi:pyridinium-3,5-bisthiocarboxylic acid mononucleotide nickel chelatase